MSVQSEIKRISTAKDDLFNWMSDKHVGDIPSSATLDTLVGILTSVSVVKYRTGTSEPTDDIGDDGDFYLVTEG